MKHLILIFVFGIFATTMVKMAPTGSVFLENQDNALQPHDLTLQDNIVVNPQTEKPAKGRSLTLSSIPTDDVTIVKSVEPVLIQNSMILTEDGANFENIQNAIVDPPNYDEDALAPLNPESEITQQFPDQHGTVMEPKQLPEGLEEQPHAMEIEADPSESMEAAESIVFRPLFRYRQEMAQRRRYYRRPSTYNDVDSGCTIKKRSSSTPYRRTQSVNRYPSYYPDWYINAPHENVA